MNRNKRKPGPCVGPSGALGADTLTNDMHWLDFGGCTLTAVGPAKPQMHVIDLW